MVEVPGYRIQHLLSWGAQGDVFLATDANGERVALKVVARERTEGDKESFQRLRREARLLAAVSSPNIVAVRALVEDEDYGCLVLEYLDGEKLDRAFRRRAGIEAVAEVIDADAQTQVLAPGLPGSPSVPGVAAVDERLRAMVRTPAHIAWVLDVGVQLARGVAAMHEVGLVHRDLKPANAMLVGDTVKLIDFGLARQDGITTLTRSGAVIGSLAFMSPEQFRSAAATQRSDVYGLGATLFYLLSGEPPHGEEQASLVRLASARRAPRCRRGNPAVPVALGAVIARALEPDPRDRYADAGALLADLERCVRGEAVRTPFSAGRLWRHHAKKGWWSAAVAASLLAAGLLWPREDASSRALELIATADRPEQAKALWQPLTDAERAAVIAVLNARLGDQHELANRLATTLALGQLRLAAREGRLVALVSTVPGAAPVAPRFAEFLPIDRSRSLLASPGRMWLLMVRRDPSFWWGPDDPKCLHLAMDLSAATGPVAERSLELLDVIETTATEWVAFEAGSRMVSDALMSETPSSKKMAVDVAGDYAVAPMEVSGSWMRPILPPLRVLAPERRRLLDAWIKHPQEPADQAERFWSFVATPRSDADEQPLLVDFWIAWRLATLVGARLPTWEEWLVASRNDGELLGTTKQREVAPLVAVDAPPTWDRTDKGVVFMNSNAMEWLLGPRAFVDGVPRYQHVPGVFDFKEGKYYFSGRVPIATPPAGAQGMRVYRSRVRR